MYAVRFLQQWQAIDILSHKEHRRRVFKYFSSSRLYIRFLIGCAAIIALGVALTNPKKPIEQSVFEPTRDVMIIVDISASMLAQDCKPNRLSCAKEKIKKLLARLNFERAGLMVFASDAYVLCPLTHDFDTFFSLLDSIDQTTISHSSTNTFSALRVLRDRLKENTGTSHVALLITDGEDFSGFSKAEDFLCEELKNNNVILSCMTIGTLEGAPIPDGKGGFLRDASDQIVITKRNDALLSQLAAACGGKHIVADMQGDRDIDTMLKVIEHVACSQQLSLKTSYSEVYAYPASIALLGLLIEWFL